LCLHNRYFSNVDRRSLCGRRDICRLGAAQCHSQTALCCLLTCANTYDAMFNSWFGPDVPHRDWPTTRQIARHGRLCFSVPHLAQIDLSFLTSAATARI
jgi:hypothetical protein